MPLLSESQIEELRKSARRCTVCGEQLLKDYCRQDDEFFERGHHPNCAIRGQEDEHANHRAYRQPFYPFEIKPLAPWEISEDE